MWFKLVVIREWLVENESCLVGKIKREEIFIRVWNDVCVNLFGFMMRFCFFMKDVIYKVIVIFLDRWFFK